jgi:hypothetical protein
MTGATFPIPTYENGIVRSAAVDEVVGAPNSVELAVNLNFDRIGAATVRDGSTLLGTQLVDNKAILGLGLYRNNAGTVVNPIAMVGTTVKKYDAGAWSDIRTGLVDGSHARFASIVDYIFMVNGTGNDVLATWGGSGNFGTTNDADLPKGDYIETFRSRVWVAQDSTDKVYYSDVVTTSNTITGGTSFIQISPNDGEKIRGLKSTARALLVFKENHIYRVFSINSTDPDPAINRGTYSQESIVDAKDGIYYHHSSGFYKYVDGGEQEEISRPINDIVRAIPRSQYEKITGWADEDHVSWSIGNITIDGITLSNVVVRRTISTQVWTVYSYPGTFRSSIVYDTANSRTILVGDEDGNVITVDSGVVDYDGSKIFYDLIPPWSYFTSVKHRLKSMSKIAVLHENAEGANVGFQLDAQNQRKTNNAWEEAGQIRDPLCQELSVDANNFMRFRPRFYGNSAGTPAIFRGFEVIDLSVAGAAVEPETP